MSRETALHAATCEALRDAHLGAERKEKEAYSQIGRLIVQLPAGLGPNARSARMFELIALAQHCRDDERLAWEAYQRAWHEGGQS